MIKSSAIILSLLCALASCRSNSNSFGNRSEIKSDSSFVASSFFYLRCNATSFSLDDKSLLKATSNPNTLEVDVNASET
jgi:hypothetical protein